MLEVALPREAPFSIEPVEAWRAWLVDLRRPHRGPFLRSITYRTIWPPRTAFHAHCLAQFRESLKNVPAGVVRHECPNANHRCGVYALREEQDTQAWAIQPLHVAGRVRLWGRILQYEKGFIAEYAYPVSLTYRVDSSAVDDEIWHLLGESYGIEVEW
jgi:hypothetical protein